MTSRLSTTSAEYSDEVAAKVKGALRDNGWTVSDPITVTRIAELSTLLGVEPASWFHPMF